MTVENLEISLYITQNVSVKEGDEKIILDTEELKMVLRGVPKSKFENFKNRTLVHINVKSGGEISVKFR